RIGVNAGKFLVEGFQHRHFPAPAHAERGMVRPFGGAIAELLCGEAATAGLEEPLASRVSTALIVSRNTGAEFCSPSFSLGARANSICLRTPPQPTSVGTERHTSRMP